MNYKIAFSVKLFVLTVVFLSLPVFAVFAQNTATIQELTGTVEISRAGSGVWENASKGQILRTDTVISTGFRSMAVIQAGSAVITVRPLTRLTLSEIIAIENSETINVNLQTGRVRMEVTPPAGTRATANVNSPLATASVRGTIFEFDTVNLTVSEGTVSFSGSTGTSVMVDAGGFSFTDDRSGRPASTEETILADLKPDLPVTSGLVDTTEDVIEIIQSAPAGESTVDLSASIVF